MRQYFELVAKTDRAELLREQGEPLKAVDLLTEVIAQGQTVGKTDFIARALGHRILCHKHLFQNTHHSTHLADMEADVTYGLSLSLSEEERAVFHLRHGDVFMLRNNFSEAEQAYAKAYELVRKGSYTEAEYLGHLAEAKANNGKCKEAIELLQTALACITGYGSTHRPTEAEVADLLRPFHRAVIVSGLKARLARAALSCRQYGLGVRSFLHGYSLAWHLKLRYGMPQRLNQYHGAMFRR